MNNSRKSIILGVTGSIAAYKAVDLLRLLTSAGHDVRVLQTEASLRFVGELTFQALSGHPVVIDQFDPRSESVFSHIDLASADIMLVAPATAGTIGKMAAGLADNLLLSSYLATKAKVMICPAMNQQMWNHPAVRENIDTLKRRGALIIEPGSGELACGDEGVGRMAEPREIFERVRQHLADVPTSKADVHGDINRSGSLAGVRVLVTAGGTREPIDSVRYITNRSSGRMGMELAEAALDRGARVTIVAANCSTTRIPGITQIDVETAEELETAVESEYESCDVLLMAAAVSDYKVSDIMTMGKIEREESVSNLKLVPTSDIVANLKNNGNGRVRIGFAAEHGEENRERARRKLLDKGLDMIVFNDISRADIGFESSDNEITIMAPGRDDIFVEKTTKRECAERIMDQVETLIA
ncbi:MAG: bifunctional phosphopantothenoylcysteine decarboxylase/phosphopantothenate--cysteine ligase CoaBC [Thermoleophilia bacterium]|nr:bifunctional phosphopantothenoylcysteine decarboxylase/phosphopantothenate--cysteine ligase CoaBC [Thermoleophilia bacterium]